MENFTLLLIVLKFVEFIIMVLDIVAPEFKVATKC